MFAMVDSSDALEGIAAPKPVEGTVRAAAADDEVVAVAANGKADVPPLAVPCIIMGGTNPFADSMDGKQ